MCWNMDQIPAKATVSTHVNSKKHQAEICYCSGRGAHFRDHVKIKEKLIKISA